MKIYLNILIKIIIMFRLLETVGENLDFIQKKYHFNVCKNKDEQNDFFIHTINNSEYFIGESGGAADLPLFLKKKILLFNFSIETIFPIKKEIIKVIKKI